MISNFTNINFIFNFANSEVNLTSFIFHLSYKQRHGYNFISNFTIINFISNFTNSVVILTSFIFHLSYKQRHGDNFISNLQSTTLFLTLPILQND